MIDFGVYNDAIVYTLSFSFRNNSIHKIIHIMTSCPIPPPPSDTKLLLQPVGRSVVALAFVPVQI